MQDLAAGLPLVGVNLNICPVHSRPGGGVHRHGDHQTACIVRIQRIIGKYIVKLAQALHAHLVQLGGIGGVIAAIVKVKILRCGALQRVQGLCAVGVAHVFQQIQIGKFLPCGKVVMVAAHIVVEHPVGAGDLQAQHGAVPVADPDDVACIDKVIAGTGIQGTLHQIAVSVVDYRVDVLGVLGVIVDLRHFIKIGVLDAVGVGVGKALAVQRDNAGIIQPPAVLRLGGGFVLLNGRGRIVGRLDCRFRYRGGNRRGGRGCRGRRGIAAPAARCDQQQGRRRQG